jgi:hypothetical protein
VGNSPFLKLEGFFTNIRQVIPYAVEPKKPQETNKGDANLTRQTDQRPAPLADAQGRTNPEIPNFPVAKKTLVR